MEARVDRRKVVEWLLDKARDEDETALHVERLGGDILEVEYHRARARALRDAAHGVERGDPDAFVPPDLGSKKRQSGEIPIDLPTGREPQPTPEVVTRPVPRDPRRDPDD